MSELTIDQKKERLRYLEGRKELIRLREQKALAQKSQQPQYQSESEIPIENEMDLPFKYQNDGTSITPRPQQQDGKVMVNTPLGIIDATEAVGVGEAALSTVTGMTGGSFGYISGVLNQLAQEVAGGNFGSMEAADRIQKAATDMASQNTYAPQTDRGKEHIETVGQVAEALTPIAPQLAEFQMLKPKLPRVPKVTKKRARQLIAQEIRSGNRDIVNIEKSINPNNGQLVANPNMKTAMKLLGNSDKARHIAILFEDMNKSTKGQVGKMLDVISDGRKFGDQYVMENRPANVIGESLAVRAKTLNNIRNKANTELKMSLKYLKNKKVDVSEPYSDFLATLKKKGVAVYSENGKLAVNLDNARVRLGDVLPEAELTKILNQLNEGTLAAPVAHEMKRYLREFVSYDDGMQVGAKQSQSIESALKTLSTGINEKLNLTSKGYKKANTKYSSVADPLTRISKQLKGIDLESDFAGQKLGALSKRIGSNLASREQIMMMVKEMDEALKKNKVTFHDDISGQVAALARVEEIFGVEVAQSPFGFQAGIAKATQSAANPKLAAVDLAASKIQKMTQLDFDKRMEALRKLLE